MILGLFKWSKFRRKYWGCQMDFSALGLALNWNTGMILGSLTCLIIILDLQSMYLWWKVVFEQRDHWKCQKEMYDVQKEGHLRVVCLFVDGLANRKVLQLFEVYIRTSALVHCLKTCLIWSVKISVNFRYKNDWKQVERTGGKSGKIATNLSFDNIIVKKPFAGNQIMFTRRKCIYLDRYL